MRAWHCPQYGSPEVLRLEERPEPAPGPGEVVVRIRAASVSTADARVRGLRFPAGMAFPGRLAMGWRGPRRSILGTDCAGVIETVGPGVKDWQVGDPVLVVRGAAFGCHAEQVRVPVDGVIARIPQGMGWAEAVSLPFGGQTARYFLQKAALKAGDEVLVIGASGAVGGAALQWIARAGAHAVAVTRSVNADWVEGLGAAELIDYTATDYTASNRQFDFVMDCIGAGTFKTLKHLAKPGGGYLAVAGGLPEFLAHRSGGVRCVTGFTPESTDVVAELLALVASGEFRPMVGERFAFQDLPAAHALIDGGHKRGTVVVEIDPVAR